VEQLGAGSRTESAQARPESALQLIRSHSRRLRRRTVGPGADVPVHVRRHSVTGVTRPCAFVVDLVRGSKGWRTHVSGSAFGPSRATSSIR
jgi:hypothetical protein